MHAFTEVRIGRGRPTDRSKLILAGGPVRAACSGAEEKLCRLHHQPGPGVRNRKK